MGWIQSTEYCGGVQGFWGVGGRAGGGGGQGGDLLSSKVHVEPPLEEFIGHQGDPELRRGAEDPRYGEREGETRQRLT